MTATEVPIALITGASSGIGRAIALELAARGYDLKVTARRGELLEGLAGEVRTRFQRRVDVIPADLGSRVGCERVEAVIAAGLDILVANAGFSTRGSFPRLPLETEVAEVELNVMSTLRLCHAAAAMMSGRGRGRILVTSSAASFQPLPGLATYGATKAFLTSFAQALDAELRPQGVSVSCLAPGYTVKERGAARPRPGWLWTTSDEVARIGVEGLLSGRPLIVPGWPWKVVAVLAPRMPRVLIRRIATAVGRRMAS
jgi:short-subunit dehydrogenase